MYIRIYNCTCISSHSHNSSVWGIVLPFFLYTVSAYINTFFPLKTWVSYKRLILQRKWYTPLRRCYENYLQSSLSDPDKSILIPIFTPYKVFMTLWWRIIQEWDVMCIYMIKKSHLIRWRYTNLIQLMTACEWDFQCYVIYSQFQGTNLIMCLLSTGWAQKYCLPVNIWL